MTRLVVHVGAQKTGSTALQHFLDRNESLLASLDVIYPHAGRGRANPENHHILAHALRKGNPEVARRVVTEIMASGRSTAVLSSESLAVQDSAATALRDAFPGFDVTIVMFVRPQHQWFESFYRMTVQSASSQWTKLPWQWPIYQGYWKIADWLDRANRFAQVFGADAVRIHPYEPKRGSDAIYSDLLGDLGLEWPLAGATLPDRTESNPSLGVEATEFKRMANRVRRTVDDDLVLGRGLARVRRSPREQAVVPPGVRRSIFTVFQPLNSRLTEQYLDSNPLLTTPPEPESEWRPFLGLDREGLDHVTSELARQGYPGERLTPILASVDLEVSRQAWQRAAGPSS